jgi:hypothetical protein
MGREYRQLTTRILFVTTFWRVSFCVAKYLHTKWRPFPERHLFNSNTVEWKRRFHDDEDLLGCDPVHLWVFADVSEDPTACIFRHALLGITGRKTPLMLGCLECQYSDVGKLMIIFRYCVVLVAGIA